jgi:hypothetical protein
MIAPILGFLAPLFAIGGLIDLLIVLVIIGVVLWAVESLIPMDATIKNIIRVVVVVAVLIWLIRWAGFA